MLQIPPGAKGTAFAPEYGDAGGVVRVKRLERLKECLGAFGVHGIARGNGLRSRRGRPFQFARSLQNFSVVTCEEGLTKAFREIPESSNAA